MISFNQKYFWKLKTNFSYKVTETKGILLTVRGYRIPSLLVCITLTFKGVKGRGGGGGLIVKGGLLQKLTTKREGGGDWWV